MKVSGTKRLIIGGFSTVLIVMTALVIFLTTHLQQITREMSQVSDHQFQKALILSRMQTIVRKRETHLAEMMMHTDAKDRQAPYQNFLALGAEFQEKQQAYFEHGLGPRELAHWQKLRLQLDDSANRRSKLALALLDNNQVEITSELLSDVMLKSADIENLLSEMLDITRIDNEASTAKTTSSYEHAFTLTSLAWIFAVILGSTIAWLVTRKTARVQQALHTQTTIAVEAAERVEWAAAHDPLTNLVNRNEFHKKLTHTCSRAKEEGIFSTLLFLDLDQFKVVNDTCGHRAGDMLLKQLALRLNECLIHHRDVLSRLGGDEFGVLLPGVKMDQGERIAQSLLKTIREFRFLWEGKSFDIGVSIGMVPIFQNHCEPNDVLAAADSACYIAKDSGRNRLQCVQLNDDLLLKRIGEMNWAQELRLALNENRLTLYAQEICPLNEDAGNQRHYEVLVRLHTKDGKVITPATFIPVAERYGISVQLDHWVINAVFKQIAEFADPRHPRYCGDMAHSTRYSINLSGQSLSDDSLTKFVQQSVRRYGINPQQIYFEITETAIITNMSKAVQFIRSMKTLGCRFALDDFGSGMSSFAYLQELEVDTIKIDGSLIRGVADDPVRRTMVSAIVNIARSMNVETVAEFIDSDRTLSVLRQIGVDLGQGYHLHRPESLPDMESTRRPQIIDPATIHDSLLRA